MGLHDRDYMQGDQAPPGLRPERSGGLPFSMCTLLIAVNVIIELIKYVAPGAWNAMAVWGHFSTSEAIFQLGFWRFITFQFLHGGIMHLAFNMLGIFFLGRLVEDQLGPKKFLAFYLVCGVFGGVMYLLLNLLGAGLKLKIPGLLMNDPSTPLIGASAGVFGVVMACAYIAPNARIQLFFPPIPMRMKTFAYGYVAITLIMLLLGTNNAGGEAAHLGGAIAGFYFIRNSHHLIDFFDILGDSRKPKPSQGGRERPRTPGVSQQEVDRVLDKVKVAGIDSLTDKEKETLHHATARQRRG